MFGLFFLPGATRFALATGCHIPRRWRFDSCICTFVRGRNDTFKSLDHVTGSLAQLDPVTQPRAVACAGARTRGGGAIEHVSF